MSRRWPTSCSSMPAMKQDFHPRVTCPLVLLALTSIPSLGCAGQFELEIPDEHPARAVAQRAAIEPAPTPYDSWSGLEGIEKEGLRGLTQESDPDQGPEMPMEMNR